MSYIHEALKKAQRERDGAFHKYSKTLLAGPSGQELFRNRTVWWTGVVVLILLLAFGLYLWRTAGPTPTTPAATPMAEKPMRPFHTGRTSNAQGLFDEAKGLHKAARMDEARRLYQEVLRKDPGYVDALNNLGVLYIREKQYPEAKKNFYKAILLHPRYVDPHYNLACVYAIEGDTSQSMAHLKKAMAIDPTVEQWAIADPDLEPLRQLPEFQELVTEKGSSERTP